MAPRFTEATYNLFSHNCNNFSDECCAFLLGQGIPKHIIDMPTDFLSTPLGPPAAPAERFHPVVESPPTQSR
jgi:hypothetical protein